MFRLFPRNNKPAQDVHFVNIEVDIHAHWIPGVDDGSPAMELSLKMIRGLAGLGFKKLIATPHIMHDHYGNHADKLKKAFQTVVDAVSKAGIEIDLGLGAEYMLDEGFMDHLNSRQILAIGDRYVLIEFPMNKPFPLAHRFIESILQAGYTPILAHPERYTYYRKDLETFLELQEMGCHMQLNLLSPTGYYGREVAVWSRQLIERQMYHFAGSDIHHPSQLSQYSFDPSGIRFLNTQLLQPV